MPAGVLQEVSDWLFRNIDPVVRKETGFIAAVELILSGLMQIVFLVLGAWDYTVLLGTLWGMLLAVGNFFLMARTVEKAVSLDPEDVKKKVQFSMQLRLIGLVAGCVIGGLAPFMNTYAVLVPQFFPRIGVAVRGFMLKGGKEI